MSVGSGIDADRIEKRKNFNGVLQDKWGSVETATGILRVQAHVRVCYGYGYGCRH